MHLPRALMTPRDRAPRHNRSLLLSLVIGALLVPLAAYGASSLVNAAPSQDPAPSPTALVPATTSTVADGPADLEIACGDEGLRLVAAEADGSISAVQQAALDALRDICAREGRSLPGAPEIASSTSPTTVATQPATVGTSPDHDDDDDHDDHDRDDDDDHRGHGRGGDDDERGDDD